MSSRPVVAPRWRDVAALPAPGELGEPVTEVHVWLFDLDRSHRLLDRLRGTLDVRERRRADAYVFRVDRARYAAEHGLRRGLLASYLAISAREVTYEYGQHGKPYLVVAGINAALRFSSARSGNLGLCAVALDRDLGVDIERIRPNHDHRGIAARYFSRSEDEAIRTLPPEQQVRAFYDCWTRKEAHLKATGRGLTVPLSSFDVPVTPDPPPTDAATGPEGLGLTALPPVPGFATALAARGHRGVAAFRLDPSSADPFRHPLR